MRANAGAVFLVVAGAISGCGPDQASLEIDVNYQSPLRTRSSPVPGEDRLYGTIWVRDARGDSPPADTAVTLNGVAVPRQSIGDTRIYDVGSSAVPPVPPGGRMSIVATSEGGAQTLVLDCPAAIALSASPDPIVRGAPVTLSWTGDVFYDTYLGLLAPKVSFCDWWSPASGHPNACGAHTELAPGASQVTITAPTWSGDLGFLVEVEIPGTYAQVHTDFGYNTGTCLLEQRFAFAAVGP